jgi:hypothetical protein
VDLPYQRTCAESDARNVAGVVGITNLIRVADHRWKPQPEETAQTPHSKRRRQLEVTRRLNSLYHHEFRPAGGPIALCAVSHAPLASRRASIGRRR